jgi:nitroreductase
MDINPIFNRACCRVFDTSKSVTNEQLDLIMRAGQMAPSVKNRQPYYFVAIQNKECRKEIVEAANEGRAKQFAHLSQEEIDDIRTKALGSNDKSIYEASAAILVFRDSDPNYTEAQEEVENLNIKEEQGVACTAYGMLLQAYDMGINTGWICSMLYIKEELRKILPKYGVKYRDTWEPRLIIPVGYSLNPLKKVERKDLDSIRCYIE